MSWCRFGPSSDLYIFDTFEGGVECCGCFLSEDGCPFEAASVVEMMAHIRDHVAAGHTVEPHLRDAAERAGRDAQ